MNTGFYKKLIYNLPYAYAYHQLIYDSFGEAIDYKFLEVNKEFENLTDLNADQLIGKTFLQIDLELSKDNFNWLKEYGEIGRNLGQKSFEVYSESLKKYYNIFVFSDKKGYFTTIFSDITETKIKSQEQLLINQFMGKAILEMDQNLNVINAYDYVSNILTKHPKEYIGKNISETTSDYLYKIIKLYCERAKSSGRQITFETSRMEEGQRKWFLNECTYTNILNEERYVIFISDITDKLVLQNKLVQSETLFQTFFEQAPIGIAIVKNYETMIESNQKFLEITQVQGEDLKITNWQDITHPEDLVVEMVYFEKFKNREIPYYSLVKRIINRNNQIVWVNLTVARLSFNDDKIDSEFYIVMIDDITDFIETTAALSESERSKEVILTHLPGIAYRCKNDENWTMLFLSEGTFGLTGYRPRDLLNNKLLSYNDIIFPEDRDKVRKGWQEAFDKSSMYKGEYRIITAQGQVKWVFEQGQFIFDIKSKEYFIEGLIVDITERKEKEMEVNFLFSHDSLTGLYNRMFFIQEIYQYKKEEFLPLSLIIGDINGLRLINNAFGLHQGDNLLIKVSNTIKKLSRPQDLVARVGGDNFAVLMPNTSLEEAEEIAEKMKKACESIVLFHHESTLEPSVTFGSSEVRTMEENLQGFYHNAEDLMFKRKLLDRKSSHSNILTTIQVTLFTKSEETEEHAQRLFAVASKIGESFDLNKKDQERLRLLSLLHDIGKIGIHDNILKKEGPLTQEEWEEMKKHPEIGYNIAISTPELEDIAELILTHHEKYDGTGYPKGLKEEEIPLISRILAVADAFDVITNDRVYKRKKSFAFAIEEINRCSGTQFDPMVVKVFNNVIGKLTEVENVLD